MSATDDTPDTPDDGPPPEGHRDAIVHVPVRVLALLLHVAGGVGGEEFGVDEALLAAHARRSLDAWDRYVALQRLPDRTRVVTWAMDEVVQHGRQTGDVHP